MVKVLVATKEAQGLRPNDMASAVEGELVFVPLDGCLLLDPQAGCGALPDDACTCIRSFAGMGSNRGTTTAMVMDRADLSPDDLWTALGDCLDRLAGPDPMASAEEFHAFRRIFRRTLATAEHFPCGSIIEREGSHVRRRAQAEPLAVTIDLIGGKG